MIYKNKIFISGSNYRRVPTHAQYNAQVDELSNEFGIVTDEQYTDQC
jgi:hypothetical protein